MSSDFGGSQQYKYQGQAALSNGRATQAAYEKKARALEAEAVSDSHLAARNMKRMRQNQNAAMGSVRAQRGGSGFTSEGSGSQAEVAVADVWESAIGDAALSNAVSDANKRFAAESARYQGAFSGMMNAYSLSGSLGGMVPGSMQSSNRLRDSLLANFMGFGKR